MALPRYRNAARFCLLRVCDTVLPELTVSTPGVYPRIRSIYETWDFSLDPKSPNSAPEWQTDLRRTVRKQERVLSWEVNFCSSLAQIQFAFFAPRSSHGTRSCASLVILT